MSTQKKKNISKTEKQNPISKTAGADAVDFETAMKNLESVIGTLENDELELTTALKSFEEGVHFMRLCDNHLRHARGKISQLLESDDGTFAEKILGTSLDSFLRQETDND